MIDVLNLYCIFSHKNGAYARKFQFGDNHVIIDIDSKGNDNERFWDVRDDELILYNKNNVQTSVFNYDESSSSEIYSTFIGKWNRTIDLRIIAAKQLSDLSESSTRFQMRELIHKRCISVGKHTLGKFSVIPENALYSITVGDYTTFKDDITCIYPDLLGKAVTNFFEEDCKVEQTSKIIIENDVTIYNGVQIFAPVTIHNGSIILPHSTVTQDIPAFAIVQGSPATIIGYRFPDNICSSLQKIAWWNWDENTLHANKEKLSSNDIDAFVQEFSK